MMSKLFKRSGFQVFVKNSEGEVVKGMPIRVVKAHSMTVTAEPHPETHQLILEDEYEIHVNIFTKDGRKIHPSEVRRKKCQ